MKIAYVFLLLILQIVTITTAADWPQFHGPKRDNISTETNLLKRWPEGGPKLIWQADGIGEGYATVAISGGMIYTAGNIASNTVITALDMDGRKLWQVNNGRAYNRAHPGARATPTIDGGKLYHLNGDGDVICLDAGTGKKNWTLNMLTEFQGRNTTWGLSESLLVDGNNVICCPGGTNIVMVALDRNTGKTVWTCPGTGDMPGYTAPLLINVNGQRQIINMTSASAIGVVADTGKLLWRFEYPARYDVNASHPIYHDGHVALFGTWGRGATLLKLNVDGDKCTAEEVWHTNELDNEHGGVVLLDGYLYGHADGNHQKRHWACIEWKTGKTMWTNNELQGPRSGCLTTADGMLYLMSEKCMVGLAPANPQKLEIVSQFRLLKQEPGPSWAHPVICGGRLYIRYSQYLFAYNIGM